MSYKKQSEINLFFRVAKELVERKTEKETKEDLRVKYALNKVSKSLKSSVESFNEEKADLALDFCSVDSDKNVIIDEKGNYKFTPEKQKSYGKKVKELLGKEVEVKPHFVRIPEGFSPSAVDLFTGFIFSEEEVERYEDQFFGEDFESAKMEVVESE